MRSCGWPKPNAKLNPIIEEVAASYKSSITEGRSLRLELLVVQSLIEIDLLVAKKGKEIDERLGYIMEKGKGDAIGLGNLGKMVLLVGVSMEIATEMLMVE
ncbi:hypothetical protein WN944_006369 [Citrus x changshan-huyou]|uniref:Uncharacterized protein n=1 Tax=Citrus x changshan-huyou TaxID=2935761 RepID=A0AAP0MKY1_9ROSI